MTRLLIAVACLALSACSMFMRSMERPTAKVRDVSISSAGFGGAAGQLQLDVTNPNSVGVPLSAIAWQLSVHGTRAVSGTVELSQTIPAKGVAPVTTSLSIGTLDAAQVLAALAGGARDYQITVRLTFSTAIGPLEVEVQHAGTIGGGAVAAVTLPAFER